MNDSDIGPLDNWKIPSLYTLNSSTELTPAL